MFEFLDERKRHILLSFPFVQDFIKGYSNVQIFLGNLKFFENDLLEKGFTHEDIEHVRRPYANLGLITAGKFIKELQKSIINNEIILSLYELKKQKCVLEFGIINKDFYNDELVELQRKFSKNPEARIIDELLDFKGRAKDFIKLLNKIKEKERYKRHFLDIDTLLGILNFLFNEGFLSKLSKNLKEQAKALKKDNYYEFLVKYQEEKIMFFEFNDSLKAIGAEFVLQEVIRVVSSKSGLRTFMERFHASEVKSSAHAAVYYCFFVPLVLITYPLKFLKNRMGRIEGNIVFTDSPKIIEYLRQLALQRPEYTPETITLARHIVEKYGIDIHGHFNHKHLKVLEDILQRHQPGEVRLFLDAVIFIEGKTEDYEEDHSGIFLPTKRTVRVFSGNQGWESTLDHEIAHARDRGITSQMLALWTDVNLKGLNYEEAQKLAKKEKSQFKGTEYFIYWVHSGYDINVPAFGYARPYGVTNEEEDIATFVQMLNEPEKYLYNIFGIYEERFVYFYSYANIYSQKAKILRKFGFVLPYVEARFQYYLINLALKAKYYYHGKLDSLPEKMKKFSDGNKLGLENRYEGNLEINIQLSLRVLERLKPEWIESNHDGLSYDEAKKRISKSAFGIDWYISLPRVVSSETWLSDFRYGFVGITTSFDEDVINFMKSISIMRPDYRITRYEAHISFFVMPYLQVYKKKFDLLYKFGFMLNDQHDFLVRLLETELKNEIVRFIVNYGAGRFKAVIRTHIQEPQEYLTGVRIEHTTNFLYLEDFQKFESWFNKEMQPFLS